MIECDLHERYALDVEDTTLMATRSWRWLQTRIAGLLDVPPSGYVEVSEDGKNAKRVPTWATRIQTDLLTTH